MHPEADALLDAIFDAPDDDTPRLVYADWLQEHGQEDYAHFLRLSVEAEAGATPLVERKLALSARKQFWHRVMAVRYDASLCARLHCFVRGVCDAVSINGDRLVRTIESWWPAITPRVLTVYRVHGFGRKSIEAQVATAVSGHLPCLRKLEYLEPAGEEPRPLSSAFLAALAADGSLRRLRSLRINFVRPDDPALRAFADSELVARLDELTLNLADPETGRGGTIVSRKLHASDIRDAITAFIEQYRPVH